MKVTADMFEATDQSDPLAKTVTACARFQYEGYQIMVSGFANYSSLGDNYHLHRSQARADAMAALIKAVIDHVDARKPA